MRINYLIGLYIYDAKDTDTPIQIPQNSKEK